MTVLPSSNALGDLRAVLPAIDPSIQSVRCCVLIPALNEKLAIRQVVEDTLRYVEAVIVVDDGSTDGTSAEILDLPVHLMRHDRPQGKGGALKNGFREAMARGFDVVITIDGDGQHAAADIPRLLAAHSREPNAIVLCARTRGRHVQPPLRRLANALGDFWISWACGRRVSDSQCGQRLYPRALLERATHAHTGGFAYESEILIEASRLGFEIASVPILARYHEGRRPSHFRPLLDCLRISRMLFWKIASRGLYLPGLVRAIASRPLVIDVDETR
jgi:glycosyltransferase involved in cell wall biosynthesis